MINARVVGVYGVIHTDAGDFQTEGPEFIDIDCEMVTVHLPITVQFTGTIKSHTLNWGVVMVTCLMDPPIEVSKGQRIVVQQPVMWSAIEATGKPVPAWHAVRT